MSVNSKMTALANEIRELSGTTEAIGLDAMKAHVGEVNDEVASQADLIAQIQSVVDNLPEAGGGSGGSIETCNLIISGNFEFIYNSINNGSIIGSSVTNPQNHSIVVPCSSLVTVYDHQTMYGITEPTQMNNMTIIYDGVPYSGLISVFQAPSIANSECSLMF